MTPATNESAKIKCWSFNLMQEEITPQMSQPHSPRCRHLLNLRLILVHPQLLSFLSYLPPFNTPTSSNSLLSLFSYSRTPAACQTREDSATRAK
ncbi:hypothetical protein E2C01_024553 [Portunus trituberculatus]|uniref:Uncharacterized protein n=1 Tax=Portunus trituberculatus TaxID=210409 RepID=A0A5B7ECM8_PORTR|nr:hypothetical protein [Portunus trituberculatus]